MNEELALESSLDLTLMQHPCDENPEPRKVHAHLEVDPFRAWNYRIFPNFRSLVIMLQVDPTFVMNLKSSMKVVMKLKTP